MQMAVSRTGPESRRPGRPRGIGQAAADAGGPAGLRARPGRRRGQGGCGDISRRDLQKPALTVPSWAG